jgi:hypothetical protein
MLYTKSHLAHLEEYEGMIEAWINLPAEVSRDSTPGGEGNISEAPGFVDPDGPDNNPGTYEDNDYHRVVVR